MGSKSNALESDVLGIILNGTAIANIADNAASSPLTNLYLAFHTADPGEAGVGNTSEATYGGYQRTAIARNPSSPAWTISGTAPTQAQNASQIAIPTWTSGATNILTHFSLTVASSAGSKILYSGALTNPVTMSAGNPTGNVAAQGITITED
jgi:hypothetical protein